MFFKVNHCVLFPTVRVQTHALLGSLASGMFGMAFLEMHSGGCKGSEFIERIISGKWGRGKAAVGLVFTSLLALRKVYCFEKFHRTALFMLELRSYSLHYCKTLEGLRKYPFHLLQDALCRGTTLRVFFQHQRDNFVQFFWVKQR